ncbi:MAG: Xaa-Pro peptidase family protein [Marivibrio sp.]|uniref:M24 family metallopeptidase n=1 Tax=Marivibrio sp. TaxID=2039719 RepID=UPI0032EBB75D
MSALSHAAAPAPFSPEDLTLTAEEISGVRLARLARLRAEMAKRDVAGLVLTDPVNVRYACDARNMQIFTARNPARYLFVAADGPAILFDFAGCEHLGAGLETLDEIRVAKTTSYVAQAERQPEVVAAFADELADLMRAHAGGAKRVGIERFAPEVAYAVQARGFDVVDAQEPVERARAIKVPNEIRMMRASIAAVEEGVAKLEGAIRPGASESEVWARLWAHVIETDGDYVETRLLNSGPRTNPWFQECGARRIEAGDMVCLDTDVVGRFGYYADFSRSWICGDSKPTGAQQTLYQLAHEQIHRNLELIRPGVTFRELSETGWTIPKKYERNRYYLLAHGIGMTGEYPYILYKKDFEAGGYDGVIEPGMVLCVESFIGADAGGEGVKLEQQVEITEDGWRLMSRYPFDERLLGRAV